MKELSHRKVSLSIYSCPASVVSGSVSSVPPPVLCVSFQSRFSLSFTDSALSSSAEPENESPL